MNKKQFNEWDEVKRDFKRYIEEIKNAHQLRLDRIDNSHDILELFEDILELFAMGLLFVTLFFAVIAFCRGVLTTVCGCI